MQIKEILSLSPSNQTITVKGWVRTKRVSSNVAFVALNDGSTIHNIKGVIADGTVAEETLRLVTTGACIALTGILIPSQGQGQSVEIQVTDILIYGVADPEKYPPARYRDAQSLGKRCDDRCCDRRLDQCGAASSSDGA
jgi:asparaginyl-tRNA synthetase